MLLLVTIAGIVTPVPGLAAEARKMTARIISIGETYGNLNTDLDAGRIGLAPGQEFRFSCRAQSFGATWTEWYGDVPESAWLGLANEHDQVQLAINNGDADVASGCTAGDTVSFELPP